MASSGYTCGGSPLSAGQRRRFRLSSQGVSAERSSRRQAFGDALQPDLAFVEITHQRRAPLNLGDLQRGVDVANQAGRLGLVRQAVDRAQALEGRHVVALE